MKGPRADRYTMGARTPESTRTPGVFLARHGETDYNASGRFQGRLAVPLNATGREQAAELAELASALGFAVCAIVRVIKEPLSEAPVDPRSWRILKVGLLVQDDA